MSIQSEITRIEIAKTAIKTAIAGKGVIVPDTAKINDLAALINSIETGKSLIVESYSIIPASNITVLYEVGTTTITKAHACFCIDGTKNSTSNDGSDSRKYHGLMVYAGADSYFWGKIGSEYSPDNFSVAYVKSASELEYKRYNYGSVISFNKSHINSFYIENGKLYSDPSHSTNSEWLFEAGRSYYIILIGE